MDNLNGQIWPQIQKPWMEIINVFKKNFDVKTHTIATKEVKNDMAMPFKIEFKQRGTRNPSRPFIIRYNKDGNETIWSSEKKKGAESLVEFITAVGVKKVYELKLYTKRVGLLVADSIDQKYKDEYTEVDGKYIYTKSENDEKINIVNDIIKRLKLDASCEYKEQD